MVFAAWTAESASRATAWSTFAPVRLAGRAFTVIWTSMSVRRRRVRMERFVWIDWRNMRALVRPALRVPIVKRKCSSVRIRRAAMGHCAWWRRGHRCAIACRIIMARDVRRGTMSVSWCKNGKLVLLRYYKSFIHFINKHCTSMLEMELRLIGKKMLNLFCPKLIIIVTILF